MKAFFVLFAFVAVVAGQDYSALTCGSVIKLKCQSTNFRLHSHDIKWGSGSGQQSVTAISDSDDNNSLWIIKGAHGTNCWQRTAVHLGDSIRLTHLNTRRNLHTHLFSSPLSGQQEVSCFGEGGNGDSSDDWVVTPVNENERGQVWTRDSRVRFFHKATGKYLSASARFDFNAGNCGGQCPIGGQLEVSSVASPTQDTVWFVSEGVFLPVESGK